MTNDGRPVLSWTTRGVRALERRTRATRGATLAVRHSLTSAAGCRALVDPDGQVTVSLTSYGERLHRVHLTIDSIGRGTVRPGRVVLWLDPGVDPASVPSALRRLQARGLEIRASPWDVRPHKKYLPMVLSGEVSGPLVTADDDVFYPRWWLDRLLRAAAADPDEVIGHRLREIVLDGDGSIAPYRTWPLVRGTAPAVRHFATGASGVLYPQRVQRALRAHGLDFADRCPTADDVWLHHVTLLAGARVRQATPAPQTFPEVPATQRLALNHTNTGAGANDRQIRATYDERTLDIIRSEPW